MKNKKPDWQMDIPKIVIGTIIYIIGLAALQGANGAMQLLLMGLFSMGIGLVAYFILPSEEKASGYIGVITSKFAIIGFITPLIYNLSMGFISVYPRAILDSIILAIIYIVLDAIWKKK